MPFIWEGRKWQELLTGNMSIYCPLCNKWGVDSTNLNPCREDHCEAWDNNPCFSQPWFKAMKTIAGGSGPISVRRLKMAYSITKRQLWWLGKALEVNDNFMVTQ